MSLTLASLIALSSAMLVLAALPSISVLAVTSRALSGGFRHGAAVSAGVVTGDIIFIVVALFGLSLLQDTAGDWGVYLKYLAAAYLLWMAQAIWRSRNDTGGAPDVAQQSTTAAASLLSSFTSGLLLTLGDQKAIFFYLGFFPAFVDLNAVTLADILVIVLITIIAVGGVKLLYAWLFSRAGRALAQTRRARQLTGLLNGLAALILVLAAAMVILRF
ncbi:MAG: LysE family translocator [Pseudohongiella sp.]|uniref:LysE family translocator n=1 Tax=Pseudohongiella sp. TaxID=1979412 RepID=UPI00349FFEB6